MIFEPVHGAWQVPEARGASIVVMHAELPTPPDAFLSALADVVVPEVEYVAFVGPDAEAVHDRFDLFVIDRLRTLVRTASGSVPMTVWLEAASIEDGVRGLNDGDWDSMKLLGEIIVLGAPSAEARLTDMLERRNAGDN